MKSRRLMDDIGISFPRLAIGLKGGTYLARFHTASATVPVVEAGLVYFSSSAVSELPLRREG
jgi:hypothetical protein